MRILIIALPLLMGCASQRPISEACAATDENGNKSAECAESMAAFALDAGFRVLDFFPR